MVTIGGLLLAGGGDGLLELSTGPAFDDSPVEVKLTMPHRGLGPLAAVFRGF